MRTFLLMASLLVAIGCSDLPDDTQPINIETPEGNITAHESAVAPVPQEITTVTGDNLKWLELLGTQGPEFAVAYLPNMSEPDLKDYDSAFRAWQTSESPKHSKEQVIEILGGYLGNKCVADFDMEWVTVTDEYGSDYAVRGRTSEVMAFPFSSVMKRIEDKEHEFLYGVYHTLKQTLLSADCKSRNPGSSE